MNQEFYSPLLSALYTIWLFTVSDLKTIVGPETAFGILSALAGPVLTANETPDFQEIISRLPYVVSWAWINLLPFAIDNQRRPESIQEDLLNKPWRPMPAQRVNRQAAKRLMQIFYLVAFVTSFYLRALPQCLSLVFLGFCYNELGGADRGFLVRNLINAFGFLTYSSGTTLIASESTLNADGRSWFIIVGLVVFTTVQTQDMYDQAGDSARARKTVPLVIGDWPARLSIAILVGFWSVFCPAFWRLSVVGYTIPLSLGFWICCRTLRKFEVNDDKLTFKIWNLWIIMLYLLPLIKRVEGRWGRAMEVM